MWSIGFTRLAAATTCAGEVTVALFAGVETHTDPWLVEPGSGGGNGAGDGNAATPEVGPILSTRVTTGHDEFADGEGVCVGGGAAAPTPPPPPQEVIVISAISPIAMNHAEHTRFPDSSTLQLLPFAFEISRQTPIECLQGWGKFDIYFKPIF